MQASWHDELDGVTLIAGTLVLLGVAPLRFRQHTASVALRAFLVFAWINVGYVFVVGNLFEYYENMRFRFETEPILLLGLVALAAVSGAVSGVGCGPGHDRLEQ